MRFESLSATLNKKDENGNPLPNIVTVSNAVRHKDSTPEGQKVPVLEIKFPAELMQYPQFESIAEFITDCGSEARALDVLNDVTQKFATSAGKSVIRTATTGTDDEIVESGLRTSKSFTWKEESKMSVKEKASLFDALMADAKNLDPMELARRVAELAGK